MRRLVTSSRIPDWLQPHLRWITLPSWALSALFHAALWGVLLVVARLPGCQPDAPGAHAEERREVGLSIRPSPVEAEQPTESEQPPAPIAALSPALAAPPAPEMIPERPPVDLQLPDLSAPAVIGAGGPPRSVAGTDQILAPSRATGGGAPAAGAGGRDGETTFLGISDTGRRFVYLIDCSSSMEDHGALRIAKSELLSSLERLQETQQFQVIFANSAQIIELDAGRFGIFHGRDSDRLEVRLQISRIQTDAGTDHRGALFAALELNPDVIFYLSDAGEPYLQPRDLDEIQRRNRGARIHAIEFGRRVGTALPPSFLTKLAAQNNGRYTYRDVTQFSGQ